MTAVDSAFAGRTILVVEDEASILDAVATALRYAGFRVREAPDGERARASIEDGEPDLMVLDWMLPDIDGAELGRELRARGSRIPILFLSAKDGVDDKIHALGAGGDDYVTKPFSLAELVARIRALLRRADGGADDDVLRFGDILLRERRRTVMRGTAAVALTDTEFAILRCFLLHAGDAVSTAQIVESVWLGDFDDSRHAVDVYVGSLGRKLAETGSAVLESTGPASYRLAAP